MRFVLVHKVASYLMVLTSSLALAMSGELHPVLMPILFIGIAASWLWEPPRIEPRRFELVWNGATVVCLLLVVFDLLRGGALITDGVYFILFLLLNKLFNRSGSKDYLQLYVLSFLQIVAATTINTDITYAVAFLFYVVFTTWTLILFFLKREMEDNYLLKYGESLTARPVQVERVLNSRKLVGGRFLMATSVVSLGVFVGALTVFFLFPRVGFGLFFAKNRSGISMSGFSDRIELGQFGVIKDDPTVVMRVEFPVPGDRDRLPSYWRGISFDHYDGRTWTKSRQTMEPAPRGNGGIYLVDSGRPIEHPIEQEIYLEPLEASTVLFGLSHLAAVALDDLPTESAVGRTRAVKRDLHGDAEYGQVHHIAFRYRALSVPASVPIDYVQAPMAQYREAVRRYLRDPAGPAPYLQLPASLDDRIPALARRIAGNARTAGEVIDRIERFLQLEFAYTLDLAWDPDATPLADFLFNRRQGHCEYFSTAMVILLRSVGIAARNVNGFYGGTWNQYGDYVAIRQGDAHSWVEVWFPGGHWMTRDPTPSGAALAASSGAWLQVLQYVDALRLRWYKYIIEYGLDQQLGLAQSALRAWHDVFGDRRSQPGVGIEISLRAIVPWLLGGALFGIGIWGFASRRQRRRPTRGGPQPTPESETVARLYERMIEIYTRRGHVRPSSSTAREYLSALELRGAPGLDVARQVVEIYEAARFGGVAPQDDAISRLGSAVRALATAEARETGTERV